MKWMRSISWIVLAAVSVLSLGCWETPKPPYGVEQKLSLPGTRRMIWAVAPAINLSGERQVDSLLQADIVFQQLQEVNGLTVIPVNRVAEVYIALRLDKVQSQEQASLVCDTLGCDGLIVPTVTAFDPYDPPKMGASLQLFLKPDAYIRPESIDPRELARSAAPPPGQAVAAPSGLVQAVGMFDAADGSVRDEVKQYAAGRSDPVGPYGAREYLVSMDRYCGFVYHALITELLNADVLRPPQ